MSYIYIYTHTYIYIHTHTHTYMEYLFFMFLDHTRSTGRSPAEIVGSNSTGGMDICLL